MRLPYISLTEILVQSWYYTFQSFFLSLLTSIYHLHISASKRTRSPWYIGAKWNVLWLGATWGRLRQSLWVLTNPFPVFRQQYGLNITGELSLCIADRTVDMMISLLMHICITQPQWGQGHLGTWEPLPEQMMPHWRNPSGTSRSLDVPLPRE